MKKRKNKIQDHSIPAKGMNRNNYPFEKGTNQSREAKNEGALKGSAQHGTERTREYESKMQLKHQSHPGSRFKLV